MLWVTIITNKLFPRICKILVMREIIALTLFRDVFILTFEKIKEISYVRSVICLPAGRFTSVTFRDG